VIFGAALPRNWWPPKRLPTPICPASTTLNGQKVGADYLRSSAQLESIGDGRYLLRLGGDPLRPIYAYTGAESDVPQKFVLDLRCKSATPEAIQAYQNNLTDVGAVAP
jgi:hypothetical protein